jgi:hypothetical protein
MAQRHDFHGNLLVGEIHDQRRQHVGRLDAIGHERLFDLRPAAVLAVLEFEIVARGACLDARGFRRAGHRQREVAGHRQAADDQRLAFRAFVARAAVQAQRQRGGDRTLQQLSASEGMSAHVEESLAGCAGLVTECAAA